MVLVDGVQMQSLAGNLVIPRPRIITTAGTTSETPLMAHVNTTVTSANPRIPGFLSKATGEIALSGISPRVQQAAETPCLAVDGRHQMPARDELLCNSGVTRNAC